MTYYYLEEDLIGEGELYVFYDSEKESKALWDKYKEILEKKDLRFNFKGIMLPSPSGILITASKGGYEGAVKKPSALDSYKGEINHNIETLKAMFGEKEVLEFHSKSGCGLVEFMGFPCIGKLESTINYLIIPLRNSLNPVKAEKIMNALGENTKVKHISFSEYNLHFWETETPVETQRHQTNVRLKIETLKQFLKKLPKSTTHISLGGCLMHIPAKDLLEIMSCLPSTVKYVDLTGNYFINSLGSDGVKLFLEKFPLDYLRPKLLSNFGIPNNFRATPKSYRRNLEEVHQDTVSLHLKLLCDEVDQLSQVTPAWSLYAPKILLLGYLNHIGSKKYGGIEWPHNVVATIARYAMRFYSEDFFPPLEKAIYCMNDRFALSQFSNEEAETLQKLIENQTDKPTGILKVAGEHKKIQFTPKEVDFFREVLTKNKQTELSKRLPSRFFSIEEKQHPASNNAAAAAAAPVLSNS